MKNYMWGAVGVIAIILIVVLSRGHKAEVPSADTSATVPAASTPAAADSTVTASDTASPAPTAPAAMNDDNTHVRADGLGITIVQKGSGVAAMTGDKVTVNYTGTFTNGTAFDSNVDPKFGHVEPFSFVLGANQVIKGWDAGVLGMQVGETRKLSIPSELAYGVRGQGPIPPNAELLFTVTLTAISHS